LCIYKDNKQLNFYTNFANCRSIVEVSNSRNKKKIPEVARMYKENMNGVDKANRYIHMYQPHIKSKSWKDCTFKGLLYSSLSNAAVYYDAMNSRFSGQQNRTPFDKLLLELVTKWKGDIKKKFNWDEHYLCIDLRNNTTHRQYLPTSNTQTRYWCNGCTKQVGERVYILQSFCDDKNYHRKICGFND
jgi:hypothetical protein